MLLGVSELLNVYADTLFLCVCFLVPRLRAKIKGNRLFKCIFQRHKLAVSAENFSLHDCGECTPHHVRFMLKRHAQEQNVVANLAFIEVSSTHSCF